MAIIEFARNKLNIKKATSSEFGPSKASVVGLMSEWSKDGRVFKGTDKDLGGTMRLGEYPCSLSDGSKAAGAYKGKSEISERHRHRYEFNNAYLDRFQDAGMKATGINPDTKLVEIVEIPSHPYFVASQFHPEYASTVLNPHPLFVSFVEAAVQHDEDHVTTEASSDEVSSNA